MTKSVYTLIKKQNGEAFAQSIRRFDNGIFAVPNLPYIVKYAGRMAEPLLMFLEGLKQVKTQDAETDKDPFELLKEAGYEAFYADTEEKKNATISYYDENEVLCTFLDSSKHLRFYILHCVQPGAENLRRADFKGKEKIDDAYALSVLSIQILKEGGFIKIVNRYNHGIEGADNTFNSNPDNIIKGLSVALKRYFKVDFSSGERNVPAGFVYQDGQIFKIHTKTKQVYFGDGFYIQNGFVTYLDKDYEWVVDDFIIDLKTRCVKSPLLPHLNGSKQQEENEALNTKNQSNLAELIDDEIRGKTLRISRCGDEKSLYVDGKKILTAKNNQLTHLYLQTTTRVAKNVFCQHPTIQVADMGRVNVFEGPAFYMCPHLESIVANHVQEVKDTFVAECPNLEEVAFYSLQKMRSNSFCGLQKIQTLIFFSLKEVGSHCLSRLNQAELLSAPQLERVGIGSITKLFQIKKMEFPSLLYCQNSSVSNCPNLEELILKNLIKIGDYCLCEFKKLKHMGVPSLIETGDFCLSSLGVKEFEAQNLEQVGQDNLQRNPKLKSARVNKLKKTGAGFLAYCPVLLEAETENLVKLERDSFKDDKSLRLIKADFVTEVSKNADLKFLFSFT